MREIIAAGIFLSVFPLFAADDIPSAERHRIIRKMGEVSAATKSIRSAFTQRKHLSMLQDTLVSQGVFYFKRDSRVRWEYTRPYQYTVIIDGTRITIDDEGRKNSFDAGSNRIFGRINGAITAGMRGEISGGDEFSMTLGRAPGGYRVTLTPKSSETLKYLTKIDIIFDGSNYQVRALDIHENSGDYTSIRFTGTVINADIPDSVFSSGR
jgi:outer membrane lipoprotein-sorting protein